MRAADMREKSNNPPSPDADLEYARVLLRGLRANLDKYPQLEAKVIELEHALARWAEARAGGAAQQGH